MSLRVRLTQIDGKMPNIALMKLSHWHKGRGDEVVFTTEVERDLFEPEYDKVYGSSIFSFSKERQDRFKVVWPGAILGGTGTQLPITVEDLIGASYHQLDYSLYPDVDYSIGFTQRGCRLRCKFCAVPGKEGKARSENTIAEIWRGKGHPKKLHLLDNDFFGNPDWRDRVAEIKDGKFRVCLSQGVNIRLIDEETAAALASIQYRDFKFKERRLYTAWDNLGDEKIFFRGVDTLEAAGVPPEHLMAYMLVGYDPSEDWSRIWHRFHRMRRRGIKPYPMVFDRSRKDLVAFQRWVNTGLYRIVPWDEYQRSTKTAESQEAFMRARTAEKQKQFVLSSTDI